MMDATEITRLTVKLADNQQSLQLAGPGDVHLYWLEQRMGVKITAQGNYLSIRGEALNCKATQQLIDSVLAQSKGRDLETEDFETALRFLQSAEDADALQEGLRWKIWSKIVTAKSPAQENYMRILMEKELVFGLGPAGTGKTFLAVAQALQLLFRGEVERLIISRPAVEAGEKLGFLPGDFKEKVDPYMRPIYDALFELAGRKQCERYMEQGTIEIAPLAFMRGRSLKRAFVILDEAQNTTAMQMKMFLTRLGKGSRMVVNGDLSQIDLPPHTPSGLRDACTRLEALEEVGIARFRNCDSIRHNLVAKILEAYGNDNAPR